MGLPPHSLPRGSGAESPALGCGPRPVAIAPVAGRGPRAPASSCRSSDCPCCVAPSVDLLRMSRRSPRRSSTAVDAGFSYPYQLTPAGRVALEEISRRIAKARDLQPTFLHAYERARRQADAVGARSDPPEEARHDDRHDAAGLPANVEAAHRPDLRDDADGTVHDASYAIPNGKSRTPHERGLYSENRSQSRAVAAAPRGAQVAFGG